MWKVCPDIPTVKFTPEKRPIQGESIESLTTAMKTVGQPVFRAGQIFDWIYKKRVRNWSDMSNLPLSLREWLQATFDLHPTASVLTKNADDVTEKLLLRLRKRMQSQQPLPQRIRSDIRLATGE